MMDNQKTVRTLYKQLLTFYPRAFREQFGASMTQTFNDLCNERQREAEQGLFGFVLGIFIETAIGIVKQHILQIKQAVTMKKIATNLISAAIISLLLVLPFVILELVNRRDFPESFPIVLFGFLWLLPVAFIIILVPLVRNVRAGNRMMANPIHLLLKIACLALIALFWGGLLNDQLPCFLGVPNCD